MASPSLIQAVEGSLLFVTDPTRQRSSVQIDGLYCDKFPWVHSVLTLLASKGQIPPLSVFGDQGYSPYHLIITRKEQIPG